MKNRDASRFLSLILRHKPDNIGIKLDKNGWVEVDILLTQLKEHEREMTMLELTEVVTTNDKKRFEFNDEITKIRAAQGHSVNVDLQLKTKRPPMELFHGTVPRFLPDIMKGGLNKMKRHAVHLSDDIKTAEKVGSRRGKEIILTVDTGAMYADGFKFTQSKNGVWLVDNVPSKYLKIKK